MYLRTTNVHLYHCLHPLLNNVDIVGLIKGEKIKDTTAAENCKNSSVILIPTSQVTLLVTWTVTFNKAAVHYNHSAISPIYHARFPVRSNGYYVTS